MERWEISSFIFTLMKVKYAFAFCMKPSELLWKLSSCKWWIISIDYVKVMLANCFKKLIIIDHYWLHKSYLNVPQFSSKELIIPSFSSFLFCWLIDSSSFPRASSLPLASWSCYYYYHYDFHFYLWRYFTNQYWACCIHWIISLQPRSIAQIFVNEIATKVDPLRPIWGITVSVIIGKSYRYLCHSEGRFL